MSTWAGTTNVTTLGTIGTGTWQGTAVADTYIASAATWDGKQDALTSNQIIDWTASSAGTIHSSNIPAIALTTVQTAANQTAHLALTTQAGDVVVRSDENKTYIHNGGTADTMSDFTLLATPTDAVSSVNGSTGAVTLTHDGFSDFVANEHIDWTTDQGSTNLHTGNYDNTWRNIDDTPADGVTDESISSNWAYDHANASNPHSVTKSQVGLGNVENTALSTWVGTTNVTTLGTIGTGTWQGTAVADTYIASAATWNAKQSALTFGIADDNTVQIDDADAADNDYAKFTANGLEGRSISEVKTDLSLNNVENTALSTWVGTTNVTTLGTIGTGTWQGTAVADTYIASAATWLSLIHI